MARYLKTGRPPEQATADAKKVRDIVTGIIEDIESRGETALRESPRSSTNGTLQLFACPSSRLKIVSPSFPRRPSTTLSSLKRRCATSPRRSGLR